MKKINNILYFAAFSMIFVGCAKELDDPTQPENQKGDLVTIEATFPEDEVEGSKVALVEDGGKLVLSWEETDKIYVSNGTDTEQYVMDTYNEKKSTFKGVAVSGESFDVIYSEAGAGYLDRSYQNQTQVRNGSTAHLEHDLWLSGVNSYQSVEFTEAWAAAKGGTFSQGGVIKFYLQLPADLDVIQLDLSADEALFHSTNNSATTPVSRLTLNLSNVTLSNNILTAYMASSCIDAEVTYKDLTVSVYTSDAKVYTKTFTPTTDLAGGKVNTLKLNSNHWNVANVHKGSGTEDDPYKIYTVDDLKAMDDKLTQDGLYFILMQDLDMSSVTDWAPVSLDKIGEEGNEHYPVFHFDGNDRVISNFSCATEYAGLFGAVMGTVKDLTFVNPSIVVTYRGGVLGSTIGDEVLELTTTVQNVTVDGLTLTLDSDLKNEEDGNRVGGIASVCANAEFIDINVNLTVVDGGDVQGEMPSQIGGLIGATIGESKFTNCNVTGDMLGWMTIGGIVGYSNSEADTFLSCTSLLNITSYSTGAGNTGGIVGYCKAAVLTDCSARCEIEHFGNSVGGFVGIVNGNITFTGCSSDVTLTAQDKERAHSSGGFAGRVMAEGATFTQCESTGTLTSLSTEVGGFVGQLDKSATFSYCSSSADVSSSAAYVGGFAGRISNAATIRNCNASGAITCEAAYSHAGGFIGAIHRGSENLIIEDSYATGSVTSAGHFAGGFLGTANEWLQSEQQTVDGKVYPKSLADVTHRIVLTRCYATGDVVSSTNNSLFYGGLVGGMRISTALELNQCYATGDVLITGSGNKFVAGLVGGGVYNHFELEEYPTTTAFVTNDFSFKATGCYAEGEVKSSSHYTGGLVGYISHFGQIDNCHATGNVTSTSGQSTGGLIGGFDRGADCTVKNSYATGAVQSSVYGVGGLIGSINETANATGATSCYVYNCYATGDATCTAGYAHVGGLIGTVRKGSDLVVEKCHASGNVVSHGHRAGGILGSTSGVAAAAGGNKLYIKKSYFDGKVLVKGKNGQVGGILGNADVEKSKNGIVIEDCYCSGDVVVESLSQACRYYGGILGISEDGGSIEIRRCFVSGTVQSGTQGATGGIAGLLKYGTMTTQPDTGYDVEDCIVWSPKVATAASDVGRYSAGAIIGAVNIKSDLSDCYRRADMIFQDCTVTSASDTTPLTLTEEDLFDQENCTATSGLQFPSNFVIYKNNKTPYHGKAAAADATISSVATTLGWPTETWDLSGDVPALK